MVSESRNHRTRQFKALDSFQIEIPSWGFANTGTRFGKFVQAAAASTIEEKFADAAEVNRLTGATPTMALHVLWDLPQRPERCAGGEGAGAAVRHSLGLDQSEPVSGPGVQVRIAVQSLGGDSRTCAGAHAGLDRDRQGAGFAGHLAVDGGRVELSGHAEHSQADRLA